MSENKPKPRKKRRRGRPVIHGGYSLVARTEILRHKPKIRDYLTEIREGLIRDLGPTEEDLSTAQIVLIDRIIIKLGILQLIEEFAREKGVFKGGMLISSLGVIAYIRFDSSVRLALRDLGIEKKKIDEALDLDSYVKEKYGKGKGK